MLVKIEHNSIITYLLCITKFLYKSTFYHYHTQKLISHYYFCNFYLDINTADS